MAEKILVPNGMPEHTATLCSIFYLYETSEEEVVRSTRSIPGYEILVLSCQRLPTGVRVYSYLQSRASSCLPERELLLAQWGARDCLQLTRTRVWQSGMPEVVQNLKSPT